VANPGCYATALQLGLLPVLDILDDQTAPVSFGVSGFSGAGRTPGERNNPDRLRDNLLPYALCGHSHEQEVSFQLHRAVCLMPHVAPFFRGLSITLSLRLNRTCDVTEVQERYQAAYADWELVDVLEAPPEISMVRETNKGIVGGFAIDPRDGRRLVLVSVIDNLRKGAASQAIENLNLMFGLPATTGLVS
jgi:N-acetyl-gamma-glutamyl-phosphate reductase